MRISSLDSNWRSSVFTLILLGTILTFGNVDRLSAQNPAVLSGNVKYQAPFTGGGIADATVTIKSGATIVISSVSDAKGNYLITGIKPGTYNIEISKANFVTEKIAKIALNAGFVTTKNVEMLPSLTLTSVCSNDPAKTRKWKLRNNHTSPVPYTWEIQKTNQKGSGTAPAGDSFFESTTEGGNVLRLFVQKELVQSKSSIGVKCTVTSVGVQVTVSDISGTKVANATVVLTYLATGATVSGVTNADGVASFDAQPIGVAVSVTAFASDGTSGATSLNSGFTSTNPNAVIVTVQ